MATAVNALSDWDKQNALNATVFINTKNGIGNGFFVAQDRIVTGAHLVEGLNIDQIKIKGYATNSEIKCRRVVQILPQHFLAILEVNTWSNVPIFGDGNTIQPNDSVHIVGYPRGQKEFTKPVSVLRSSGHCKVKIKLPLTVENDGGPVLNLRGEVIGIHFAGAILNIETNYHFSFVVPINALRNWIRDGQRFTPSVPVPDICRPALRRILKGNAAARKVAWLEKVDPEPYLRIIDDLPTSKYLDKAKSFFSRVSKVRLKTIIKIFRAIP